MYSPDTSSVVRTGNLMLKTLYGLFIVFALLVYPSFSAYASEAVKAGKVVALKGDVRVRRADGNGSEKVSLGDMMFVEDTLVTARSGIVKVLLKDESVVTLSQSGTLIFRSCYVEHGLDERKIVLTLMTGKMRVLVDKSFSARLSSFEVQTPTGIARVRGTHFVVVSNLNNETVIYCLDGEVDAMNRDTNILGTVTLLAGECAEILEDMVPSRIMDCIEGTPLHDLLGETTVSDLEVGVDSVMIGSAELLDMQSYTLQDLQEILGVDGSKTGEHGYGQTYIQGGDEKEDREGKESPLRNIPHGGTGGGGRDLSPNGS